MQYKVEGFVGLNHLFAADACSLEYAISEIIYFLDHNEGGYLRVTELRDYGYDPQKLGKQNEWKVNSSDTFMQFIYATCKNDF